MAEAKKRFRTEQDSLGEVRVPAGAYYGAQTARAAENFPVSGIPPKRDFIAATGMVKKAACLANAGLGLIDRKSAKAVAGAADEVITGALDAHFIVDVYQAGAGTSHNMNANEVIANRANEMLGGRKGVYRPVHPNDHVNMAQSTNDTVPTAMRVAALLASKRLLKALRGLERAFSQKARRFSGVIKSGRTHLQDAVPVTLGGEFASYASALGHARAGIEDALEGLEYIGLGATAAGTGLNAHPRYRAGVIRELRGVSGLKGLKPAPDLHEAINSMGAFTGLSGALRGLAVELTRIANDLRLLSSGPRTGLGEIRLPPVQPGSSIMPGKVNPVMAEMTNMVCFQVMGNDLAVAMAAGAGQMDLNVMGPVINYNILQSMDILASSMGLLAERCIAGIRADRSRCARYFEDSVGLATVLNTFIGYEAAADVAKESARTGRTIKEVVIERGILTPGEWDRLLRPENVTRPFDAGRLKKP
ncbi:MAG: aspartate ammonia-lyase [Thermodesulfobacteriota bacterium]